MILYIPKTDKCDWYEPIKGTYDRVCKAVANPSTKYTHKDQVPLWAFYTPKQEQIIGYYGKTKFITDNFSNCFALLMDFDGDEGMNLTFDEAKDKFKGFAFAMYTSYRHTPEKHKFRMVIPLAKPMNHCHMRVPKVKEWFKEIFIGVDVNASLKSLQKHKIPAHHPDDTNYRWYVNDAPRLVLPLDQFELWEQEYFDSQKPIIKYECKSDDIFNMTFDEIEYMNTKKQIEAKHRDELSMMSWNRGSGNNVHGNLCRIAYSLQQYDLDYYNIIMEYAPHTYSSEVKRMRV